MPYLDADGDPTDPTTPDTEVSKDAGAFADCAEEVTTITGTNGVGYITLTGAEMDAAAVALAAKVASGPKATIMTLYPRELAILESGTAQAGAAGTITLAAGAAAFDLTGCFVKTTGGTGGGGAGGLSNQVRKIASYNTGTKVATLAENWETNPDATTTYDVLLPEGTTPAMFKALQPTTAGRALDVSAGGEAGLDWANIGSPTTAQNLSGTNIDVDQVVASVSGAVGSVTGAVTVGTNNDKTGYALSAAGVQAIWDALTSALTTAGSIGKLLVDNINATIGSRSSHAAADIWSVATRLLTAGTNIVLAKGVGVTGFNDLDASGVRTAVGLAAANLDTQLSGIQADTDDLQTKIGVAGAGLTAIPWNAAWDAEVESEALDALRTQLQDAVPADGTRPTYEQALYMLVQFMLERAVAGTTVTVKKADGTTTLFTLTLNDGTSPTSITRAT